MRSCEDERSGKNSESRKKKERRKKNWGGGTECTESAQKECPAVPGALLIGGG